MDVCGINLIFFFFDYHWLERDFPFRVSSCYCQFFLYSSFFFFCCQDLRWTVRINIIPCLHPKWMSIEFRLSGRLSQQIRRKNTSNNNTHSNTHKNTLTNAPKFERKRRRKKKKVSADLKILNESYMHMYACMFVYQVYIGSTHEAKSFFSFLLG